MNQGRTLKDFSKEVEKSLKKLLKQLNETEEVRLGYMKVKRTCEVVPLDDKCLKAQAKSVVIDLERVKAAHARLTDLKNEVYWLVAEIYAFQSKKMKELQYPVLYEQWLSRPVSYEEFKQFFQENKR